MGVLANLAGDVGLGAAGGFRRRGEERVQPRFERSRAAERIGQSGDVVRHEETVLPRIRLRVMVVDLARVERREPAAVEPRAHEAGLRIQHVLPVLRGGHKLLIFSEMPEPERHLCHAPVVEGILKRFRHALVFVVGQHETVSAETVHAEGRVVRGRDQRLERVLIVKALQPARDCVRDHGGAVVAYHAVGLPT